MQFHCCPSYAFLVPGNLHDPHPASTITIRLKPCLVSCTSLLHSPVAAYTCFVVPFRPARPHLPCRCHFPALLPLGSCYWLVDVAWFSCAAVRKHRFAMSVCSHIRCQIVEREKGCLLNNQRRPCLSAASLVVQLRQVISPARMHQGQQCRRGNPPIERKEAVRAP